MKIHISLILLYVCAHFYHQDILLTGLTIRPLEVCLNGRGGGEWTRLLFKVSVVLVSAVDFVSAVKGDSTRSSDGTILSDNVGEAVCLVGLLVGDLLFTRCCLDGDGEDCGIVYSPISKSSSSSEISSCFCDTFFGLLLDFAASTMGGGRGSKEAGEGSGWPSPFLDFLP